MDWTVWTYGTLIRVLILAEAGKGGVECVIGWRIRQVNAQKGWAANFVLVDQTPIYLDLFQSHPRAVIFVKSPHSLPLDYDFVLNVDVKLDREGNRVW